MISIVQLGKKKKTEKASAVSIAAVAFIHYNFKYAQIIGCFF